MSRNPVVVGLKETQPTALQFATDAALARGVDLQVIHCVEPLIAGDVVMAVDEKMRAAGQAILDAAQEIVDLFEAAPAVTYELIEGSPAGILSDAAVKASLVVVGTDEPDWGARLFTDKVAERAAKHARVPVAIVPEWSRTHNVGGSVYVALDGRGAATGPLRFAFTEASRQLRKVLHVLHAPAAGTRAAELDEVRAEVAEILAGWSEEFPDVQVTSQLVFDETEDSFVETTKEAGLFVLGRAAQSGIGSLFGHPIIAEMARNTQCPTVVVPNDWEDR